MPENAPSFNLVEVTEVLQRRWKTIATFVLIALAVTTGLLFFVLPKSYRSVAVVVAANPALADKARLFNPNIEGLYSSFGSGDDLDRLYGIAQLDTTFKMLADEFDMVQYYKISGDNEALNRRKAVLELKDDLQLQKTELNQLKIIVWTKNKDLSANMANRMVEIIQSMAEGIWQQAYKNSYDNLNRSIARLYKEVESISDSLRNMEIHNMDITAGGAMLMNNKQTSLLEQIKEYQRAANEFKLAMDNKAPALIILENAYPSAKADKPKKIDVIVTTLLISFLFAVIAALVYDRKQTK